MKSKVIIKIILMSSLFLGCQRQVAFEREPNRLIPIPEQGEAKTANIFGLWILAGHDGSKCPGCITIAGHTTHQDCQGHGNKCRKSSSVTLQQIGTDITATTTDTFGLTSEDFFLMPDRSLNYTDEKGNRIFLNIPGQMAYRDTTTLQFTFTGLFFSETAAYSNN